MKIASNYQTYPRVPTQSQHSCQQKHHSNSRAWLCSPEHSKAINKWGRTLRLTHKFSLILQSGFTALLYDINNQWTHLVTWHLSFTLVLKTSGVESPHASRRASPWGGKQTYFPWFSSDARVPDRQLHASFMISVGGNKPIPGYLHVAANTDNRQTAFKRASQPQSAGQTVRSEKKGEEQKCWYDRARFS